jgi:hypothetical protein
MHTVNQSDHQPLERRALHKRAVSIVVAVRDKWAQCR